MLARSISHTHTRTHMHTNDTTGHLFFIWSGILEWHYSQWHKHTHTHSQRHMACISVLNGWFLSQGMFFGILVLRLKLEMPQRMSCVNSFISSHKCLPSFSMLFLPKTHWKISYVLSPDRPEALWPNVHVYLCIGWVYILLIQIGWRIAHLMHILWFKLLIVKSR